MKILITTGIFPPDHGGPASYVPKIALGLQQCGHTIIAVVTLSDSPKNESNKYTFPVIRLRRQSFRIYRWIKTICTIAKFSRGADVLYLNGLVFEGVVAGKIITNRPVVIKVVGDLIWEKARTTECNRLSIENFQKADLPLKWSLLRKLQGHYTDLADAVIIPSRYLAKIVRAWGVTSKKIHIIYNSVTVPAPAKVNLGSADYDLVSVARLVPWKGLEDLIDVVAELGLTLRIVGDGPLRKSLEARSIKKGAYVSFAGHVNHDLITGEIRKGRLFVLNSQYEGLPHIVLEAKAAGVAVLASAAGGTPETIQHGVDGWLIAPNDKTELAKAIALLLSDAHLRSSLAKAAFRQVVERFCFTAQCQATETLLAKVCK